MRREVDMAAAVEIAWVVASMMAMTMAIPTVTNNLCRVSHRPLPGGRAHGVSLAPIIRSATGGVHGLAPTRWQGLRRRRSRPIQPQTGLRRLGPVLLLLPLPLLMEHMQLCLARALQARCIHLAEDLLKARRVPRLPGRPEQLVVEEHVRRQALGPQLLQQGLHLGQGLGARDAGREAREGHDVGPEASAPDLREGLAGAGLVLGPRAGHDEAGQVAHVRLHALPLHDRQHLARRRVVAAPAAGAHGGAERHLRGQHAQALHLLEHAPGRGRVLRHAVGGDEARHGDGVRPQAGGPELLQQGLGLADAARAAEQRDHDVVDGERPGGHVAEDLPRPVQHAGPSAGAQGRRAEVHIGLGDTRKEH
mmetsp:Transcript_114629/g.356005  ORF Transcript_114629/g.356005 Transcript_114629/m.356005 type:complete len:364 (-) Transcript_114629:210-1301(-)